MHTCMPGLAVQNYATYPSMPGALPSIMPGQTWRDNGHKALCPLSGALRGERLDRLEAAVLGGGRDLLAPTARKSYLSSPFLRLGRRERSEPGSTGRLLTE